MKKSSNTLHTQQFARERGTPVSVAAITARVNDGSSLVSYTIDLTQAPSPDRSYPAELVGLSYENGLVIVMFGQRTRNGAVRSLIEVVMPPEGIVRLLNAVDEMSNPTFSQVMASSVIGVDTLTTFEDDPKEVARLKANAATVGFSGSEACVDFYDMSPFSVARVHQGASTANVLGVVRIDTQTLLVGALVAEMRKVAKSFPIPAEMAKES